MSLASELGSRFKIEFAAKIIGVISSAILIVALARLLTPDDYGLLFLAISVLGMFSLLGRLGIARSAARYIAEYKEKDISQIPHILKFAFLLNIATVVVICVIFLILHEHVALWIGESNLVPFFLLGVLYIGFYAIVKFPRFTLQGFENIKMSSIIHSIDRSGRLIFAIGLVFFGYGALGALFGYILASFLAGTVGIAYLYFQYYRGENRHEREPGLRRRIAEYAIPITITNTANVLNNYIDTILVGFFLNPTAVAFYTIGKQVTGFIETPISALGFTLSPTFEAQKAKGNDNMAARIYEEAVFHGLLLYLPAAAGLVLLAKPLIRIVFGSQYLDAAVVLQVFALYVVLRSVVLLTSNALDFLGHARQRAIAMVITAVLNVLLNILLIPRIDVVGAAIATVISYSLYTGINIYLIVSYLEIRIKWLIKKLNYVVLITIIMSSIIYPISDYVVNIITLLIVVAIGVLIWLLLSIYFNLLNIGMIKDILD